MKQPLISIIVPVYNAAPYLSKCLDSISGQTYNKLEIICIDDGSTDNSAEILNQYASKDSRIIVITQENAGQSAARNAALDIAKGEWIMGIDSDDWVEPDTCEYFVNKIQNSDAKLVLYGLEYYNGTQNKVTYKTSYEEGEYTPTPLFISTVGNWFCNKIWHRGIIDKDHHRLPTNLWWEDNVFFYEIAPYLDKILLLPDIKYHYMRYDDGESTLDKAANFHPKVMDGLKAVEMVLEYYKKYPLPAGMELTPSLFLQKLYNLFIINNIKLEQQEEAWNRLRKMVDEHNLLDDIRALPNLSLQYNLPPLALAALAKLYSKRDEVNTLRGQANNIREQLELAVNYKRLLKLYRITQLKCLFSWGKRRKKYKERKQKLKSLLRKARSFNMSGWNKLKKLYR